MANLGNIASSRHRLHRLLGAHLGRLHRLHGADHLHRLHLHRASKGQIGRVRHEEPITRTHWVSLRLQRLHGGTRFRRLRFLWRRGRCSDHCDCCATRANEIEIAWLIASYRDVQSVCMSRHRHMLRVCMSRHRHIEHRKSVCVSRHRHIERVCVSRHRHVPICTYVYVYLIAHMRMHGICHICRKNMCISTHTHIRRIYGHRVTHMLALYVSQHVDTGCVCVSRACRAPPSPASTPPLSTSPRALFPRPALHPRLPSPSPRALPRPFPAPPPPQPLARAIITT